jgi:signal transduction histidine kinase
MAMIECPTALASSQGEGQEAEVVCPGPGEERTEAWVDELLGTLAHELRGPLTSILSAVQLIGFNYYLDPAARRALAGMERQARQAVRIIDDLFDASSGAWGKLSVRKETVDLTELARATAETVAPVLAARRHRLTLSLPSAPLALEGDPSRLTQVLTNLLGNAAKFTDPGGDIRLTAAAADGQVVLRVRDNGRGIAPHLLPRLFDRYYQAPGAASGGLGIGLALVKSLVELHGGSVAAYSDGPGTGAEFVVRLPARRA